MLHDLDFWSICQPSFSVLRSTNSQPEVTLERLEIWHFLRERMALLLLAFPAKIIWNMTMYYLCFIFMIAKCIEIFITFCSNTEMISYYFPWWMILVI